MSRLILVEGLPGSGKSTIAKLIHEIAGDMSLNPVLFQEGDVNHPADYESTAYVSEEEYLRLKEKPEYQPFLKSEYIFPFGEGLVIPYGKLKKEYGEEFPSGLLQALYPHDIYELPFELNEQLISERWKQFAQKAYTENYYYIFECCFIQNPVTVGMVKYGVSDKQVLNYIEGLANEVSSLRPLLIYIEQDHYGYAFEKAVKERSPQWSKGFAEYYTKQGYGKKHGMQGLGGALEVLMERRRLENSIYDELHIAKVKINNSNFNTVEVREKLKEVICRYSGE
ncbi:hypothetical protein [Peribacillus deserti]|uniref:Uncharacterized protein n=1 Tax=Peribacillus deserti TaxID=673318 RepID=A0A2N5M7L7_9BACI|nr:hypothetical protein [Peribacillus deserti]PLT30346.1 hypothetical protein CUU66_08375 [Peribacillus deserti]